MQHLTFIILTHNEENIICDCLDSLKDIPAHIFVVDDYSTDNTLSILEQRNIQYTQHKFVNYSIQRNWAQQHNPYATEWVFHLDADERLSDELRAWMLQSFRPDTDTDAYLFPRRAVFMGRWIKHGGHYPNNYHARLYRVQLGKCEDKAYDQHFITSGSEKIIYRKDIINILSDSLDKFILSENKWAGQEARGIISGHDPGEVVARLGGNPVQQRRWLKNNLFQRTPLFVRSFLYFIYRYIFRLGFLDGKEGLIFHVLQGFWFRFLVDAKVYEIQQQSKETTPLSVKQTLQTPSHVS